ELSCLDASQAYIFEFDEVLDAVARTLAAQARRLHATKGSFGRGNEAGIDADHAVFERLGHTPHAREVARIEVRGEAKLGVVGLGYDIGFVGEAEERGDRPKGFLAGNGHVRRYARDDGGLEEGAAQHVALAAGGNGAALGHGIADMLLDLF